MGSCDHSVLVEELVDCDSKYLARAGVGKGSEYLCLSPHSVPAEVGKCCLGDSSSEECREVVLEKQLCSELTKESVHEQGLCSEVSFAESKSNADPVCAMDIKVPTPTPKVRGKGLVGECDNVACLATEEAPHNEWLVGGVCLHDGLVKSEGLCFEKKSFMDVCEAPLKLLPFTGILRNCGEPTEQKDTNSSDGSVAVRTLEVDEVKIEIVGTCFCQEVPAKGCEMPSELLYKPAGSPITHVEEDNDSNSIDDSSGKTILKDVEENGEVNTCNRVLPSLGCGMSVEVLHTSGSPGNCAQHVEQNMRNSVSTSSTERVSEVVLEKSDVDTCTYILLSQSNHVQQNEEKDRNSVNGDSAVRVVEMREEKDDILNVTKMETHTNRTLVEEYSCNFKEGASNVAFDHAVENSVTPHAFPPIRIASNETSKMLDVSDYSETGAVIAGSNSSITMDSFELMDNEERDKVDFDSVLVAKTPESMCQSSRRSMHRSKSRRETQTEKVAKKCRKMADKVLHSHKTIEILSTDARRKRSCFSKPARSSVWGFLGNISELFEQNKQLDVHKIFKQGKQKARKARGGRGNKRDGSREGGSSLGSKGKGQPVTSRIRLKIKFGKQVDQSSIKVMASELENTSAPDHEVTGNYRNDGLGEEMPRIRQFQCIKKHVKKVEPQPDASYLDVHRADKDLESSMTLYKSSRAVSGDALGISTLVKVDVEALGEGIEDKYLDPGTSPDSEVINQIPDARVGLRVQEDMHDAPTTSSNEIVSPGDVKRLNFPQTSGKKGRKNGKTSGAGNCIVNSLSGSASKSIPGLSDKPGPKKALNMSSSKELCRERLPLPNDVELSVFREALTMGCELEDDIFPMTALGLGSFESENVEKLLPSLKMKGHKSSKSLKSSGVRKSKSEVPDIAGSRRGNVGGQKETRRKSVNKSKTKEKGVSDKVICKVESQPEIGMNILVECLNEGNHVVDNIGGMSMGDKAASDGKSNLDMVLNGALEPYLPPRNAWVSCDECQKWRRIPATLADSIEDTNCKWTCKDNMDKAFADCLIPQEKSNAEINVELDISDASCEEDATGGRYNSKGLELRHSAVSQPSSWRLIKSNMFLHRRRKTQTIDEIMVCYCKSPVHGRSGCGDECLNRMLNIECVQGTCPCGDRCSNQQFQKHNYAKLTSFRCGKKGYGLQLLEDISKGQFLIEYVGEVLDLHAYEARQMEYASRGHKHFYFMTLNGSEVIDACAKGNLGRFINHSCDPNCRTEKWMVNGEICIGLFAIRDIKKGEELTFDYNYVRVFGAAAKKCVCGSSQCRGYIGGDPLSTEAIVQGDSDEEYPEPLMVLEDDETFESLDNVIPKTSAYNDEEVQTEEASKGRNSIDESTGAVGQLKITTENEESTQRFAPTVPQSQISEEILCPIGKLPSFIQPVELPLQTEDVTSKPIPTAQQDITTKQEAINKSLSPVPKLETPLTSMPGKSVSHTYDASKNSQSDKVEDNRVSSKSQPLMQTLYSTSSVKKVKHKSDVASAKKSQLMPDKPKKVLQVSDNGRYEAVEEKLNELLDADGGISKRKDASKGYLKLLLLTAASGDSGNGEAIQSIRDLSMILDALLKTKSRIVLVDIINKNGLRMLHNIMKQSRKEYNKTPILRKLLKVLEYLAAKEILTSEHINGGPPCPGMESFRESILTLTEHNNKQVHQIARNFRDRLISRPSRKFGCMERDDGRMEYYKGSNCNRFLASRNYAHDQGVKATEAIDCTKQSVVATTSVAGTQEECSSFCGGDLSTNGTKIRKRKSRWDQPAEMNTDSISPQFKEQKVQLCSLQDQESSSQLEIGEVVQDYPNRVNRKDDFIMNHTLQDASDKADDGGQTMHEDVPPGFSYPLDTCLISPSTSIDHPEESVGHSKCPFVMVTGHPQERFIACLPVSYGIPLSMFQQTGIPEAESVDSWTIAPGIAFHPFPPLPPHPRNRANPSPSAKSLTLNQAGDVQGASCGANTYHMDQSTPSTSGAGPTDVNVSGTNSQYMFDRARGCSNDLGKRFRQQKWNNTKLTPPWLRKRHGWGYVGNNARNGNGNGMGSVTNELKHCSEDVSGRMQNSGNTFYQQPQHQNQH